MVPMTPPIIDQIIASYIQKKMSPGKKGKATHKNIKIGIHIIPNIFFVFSISPILNITN
jgi:hypothetical protein